MELVIQPARRPELPPWSRNPHTGPVYPITGVLWEPRDSSYPASSLGGVSTQEIRKSSRGTTGHKRRKSRRPQHGLMPVALVSGPVVEANLGLPGHSTLEKESRMCLYSKGSCRESGWVESHSLFLGSSNLRDLETLRGAE